MMYGADYIFEVPDREKMTPLEVVRYYFGYGSGWVLSYDFTSKEVVPIVCVYNDSLTQQGREGLLLAKLAWKQLSK